MNLKVGQKYRVVSDGAVLTVDTVEGERVQYNIFRNNKNEPGQMTASSFKSLIGQNKLAIVDLHKPQDNNLRLESRFGRAMGKFTDYASKVISILRRNNIDETAELDLGLISNCFSQSMNSRDCANLYLKSISKTMNESIEVKEVKPYSGLYSDANGDKFYKDAKNNLYTKVDGQWHSCTQSGEADYPIHDTIVINESKDINEDLMGSLVGMGYGPGGSRTVKKVSFKPGEKALFKDPNDNKTKKVEIEYEEEHKGETIYNLIYLNPADDIGTGYAYQTQLKKIMSENKKSLKEEVTMDLNDIADEINELDLLPGYVGCENEGDVVRIDFADGEDSIWLYPSGEVDGSLGKKAKAYLKSKGFTINENKNMQTKKILRETSHEIASPKYMVNYEEGDVVTAIKAAFEEYDGCTCTKIAAIGDTQFYNVNVTVNADDEYTDLEAKRFMISQKVHKVRAELFADLSAVLPVVNINMANYAFTKNEDKVTFNLTILMSNTNQRDWVTGEYKQKDKKLSDKLDKILDAKTEKFMESKKKITEKKKINEGNDFMDFRNLIQKIASNVLKTINEEAGKIESDMTYKSQYVLEEVIKVLQQSV